MSRSPLIWAGIVGVVLGLFSKNPVAIIPGGLVFVLVGVSRLWTSEFATRGVTADYTLERDTARFGDSVLGWLSIQNDQPFPVFWLECDVSWPAPLCVTNTPLVPSHILTRQTLAYVISLRWFERVKKRAEIACYHRGQFSIGPIQIGFKDPFGISSVARTISCTRRLLVYPRTAPLLLSGSATLSPFGERARTNWLFDDPLCFRGIREYTSNDPFSRIEWNATARTTRLQVRVTDASFSPEVVVFVDLCSGERVWQGIRKDWVERTIVVAASVLGDAARHAKRFGVCTNGVVEGHMGAPSLAAGSGSNHFSACMALLARLQDMPGAASAATLARFCSKFDRAEIIVVSALCAPDLMQQVERQRALGRQIVVVHTAPDTRPPVARARVFTLKEKGEWDDLETITLCPVRR